LGPGADFEQDHQRKKACGWGLTAIKPIIERPGLYPEQPGKIVMAQIMSPHEAAQVLRQAVAFPSCVRRAFAQRNHRCFLLSGFSF
jgi:hypothetical protein